MPETKRKKKERVIRKGVRNLLKGVSAADFRPENRPDKKTNEYLLARSMKALDMRLTGKSYQEIGDELGVSYVTAYNDCKKLLARYEDQLKPNVEHVRRMERNRLDKMLSSIWPRVEAGDDNAIDKALKIMERRAKIQGLDMPARVQLGDDPKTPFLKESQETLTVLLKKLAGV